MHIYASAYAYKESSHKPSSSLWAPSRVIYTEVSVRPRPAQVAGALRPESALSVPGPRCRAVRRRAVYEVPSLLRVEGPG